MATPNLSQESIDSLRTAKSKLMRGVIIFAVIDALLVLVFVALVMQKGLTGSMVVYLPLLVVPMLGMIPTITKLGAVEKELKRRQQ
ncbi:hypothetical protein [Gemmatimonas phototrophica]|uniref:Uncharacterized protein n=1 Tax=Gemmatimonas phototrophica TaxID=1379270 RepID=A0A143BFK0_9BACT|nr:hypothetical protein [Gemmatimonas phototrophica]AMW03788.1 hypothetical protein GEMMAAP_00900 [Gemmatimonas phototrophica]